MSNGPFSGLADYDLQHLPTHLAAAHRTRDLHRLLAWETDQARNAWYEAKESMSAIAYQSDVHLAWEAAEKTSEADGSRRRAQRISLQIRYALVTSSLASIAIGMPPRLLEAAVKTGLLSAQQALAFAQQADHPIKRVEILTAVLPGLRGKQKEEAAREAVQTAETIKEGSLTASALARLGPHLPEPALGEALSAAQSLPDGPMFEALAGLLPRLAELGHAEEALRAARGIPEDFAASGALALAGVACHLPDASRLQVFREARETALRLKGFFDAHPLENLAARLAECRMVDDALSAARLISLAVPREQTLAALVVPLAAVDRTAEALELACKLEDVYCRAEALANVARYLSPTEGQQVLQDALLSAQSEPGPNMELQSRHLRALAVVAANLAKPARDEVLRKALATAQAFRHGLDDLAPHLPREWLERALGVTRTIGDTPSAARALICLSLGATGVSRSRLLRGALKFTQQLSDPRDRLRVLVEVLPRLEGQVRRRALRVALAAAAGALDEHQSEGQLDEPPVAQLLPLLPAPSCRDGLGVVRRIRDERERAEALAALAPQLPGELLPDAADIALALDDEDARAKALVCLAPHLGPEELHRVLASADAVGDERRRSSVLTALAPRFAELGDCCEARRIAEGISDPGHRARALAGVATRAAEPERLAFEALRAAQAVKFDVDRVRALEAVAACSPKEVAVEASMQAVSLARQLSVRHESERALERLARMLAEAGFPEEALKAVRAISDEGGRSRTLAWVAARHPSRPARERGLREAIAIARTLEEGLARSMVLADLMPELPEAFRRGVLQELELAPLAAEVPRHLIQLAPYLPQRMLIDALGLTAEWAQSSGPEIVEALAPRLSKLPSAKLVEVWRIELRRLSTIERKHFLTNLSALTPMTTALGSPSCIQSIFRTVQQAARWWP